MKLARRFELTPDQAAVAIGALRTVLEAGGPIDPREEELLAACAEALELGDGWQAIAAVDAPRAAQAFTTPGARLHLVHALIVAACSSMRFCKRARRASLTSWGVSSARSAAGVPGRAL